MKDHVVPIALAPSEYRWALKKARETHPGGSDRVALKRYLEDIIGEEIRQRQSQEKDHGCDE